MKLNYSEGKNSFLLIPVGEKITPLLESTVKYLGRDQNKNLEAVHVIFVQCEKKKEIKEILEKYLEQCISSKDEIEIKNAQKIIECFKTTENQKPDKEIIRFLKKELCDKSYINQLFFPYIYVSGFSQAS